MFDFKRIKKILINPYNKVLKDVLNISDPRVKFDRLLFLKDKVSKKAYAKRVRMAIQGNTKNVSLEVLLKALEGLKQKDLMSKKEIVKFNKMSDFLTIYRGTDSFEDPPRISWSLVEEKAEKFYKGQMFRAVVSKKDIIAYFSSNTDEEEILVHVTDNYKVI